jgi:hypothetical protein
MKLPKVGSKWWSGDSKTFYIKAVVELEGKTWVYYGEYGSDREYSCYLESFLERFTEMPS